MAASLRRPALAAALVALLAVGGALAAGPVADWLTPDPATDGAADGRYDGWTRVTVVGPDGTPRGTVAVRVADTLGERYTGLSDTSSLGANEGMLLVHDAEGEHAYVMRGMAFPIDIVFVDANRTITAIHHAPTEEPPLTRYEGRGKWVLEVPYRWTERHGVAVGDRIRIEWATPDG